MLKVRVLIGLLAAPLLALGASIPAATAAPLPASARAVHAASAAPANPHDCDIRFNNCFIIDDTAHPRYIYGNLHNQDLSGGLGGIQYRAIEIGTGPWYFIEVSGSNPPLCWNLDSRFVDYEIALDSCQYNDANEYWKFVPVGSGDSFIENDALGTHWAVHCCLANSYLDFTNGATDGTESWYWSTIG